MRPLPRGRRTFELVVPEAGEAELERIGGSATDHRETTYHKVGQDRSLGRHCLGTSV